jgi:hypothetical protein
MFKSADAEVRSLIASLGAEDGARREAAVARLIIIGNRAVGRLVALSETATDRDTQLAVLQILEASGDDRALPVAKRALAAGGDVAVGAVAVLRELLGRSSGATHVAALDLLLTVSGDASVERRVRAAADAALASAPDDIRRAVKPAAGPTAPADVVWEDAIEGRLPDRPEALADALAGHAGDAPLALVHRVITAVRDRESAASPRRRPEWRTVRGALHQALAQRSSRIALYDLRETLETATEPLPPTFLEAVHAIGDRSCLEPLAAAFAHAPFEQTAWRSQLADAFHALTKREHLTRKHAAVRRALAKAPELGQP